VEDAVGAQQTPGFRSQKLLLPEPVLPDEPVDPVDPVDPEFVEPPPMVAPPLPVLVEPLDVEPELVTGAPPELEPLDDVSDEVPDEVDEDDGVVGVVSVGVVDVVEVALVSSVVTAAAAPVGGTRSGLDCGSGATCVPPPQPATVTAASSTRMEARGLMVRVSPRAPSYGGRRWGTR
jgi:hypothetical protein